MKRNESSAALDCRARIWRLSIKQTNLFQTRSSTTIDY